MTFDQLLAWAFPASVSALAIVLWWMAHRLWAKLDRLQDMLHEQIGSIKERLARIEGHIWPQK